MATSKAWCGPLPVMKAALLAALVALLPGWLLACSSDAPGEYDGGRGGSGASGTQGAGAGGRAAAQGTGGVSGGAGSQSTAGVAGSEGAGGMQGSGGMHGSGGAAGAGGRGGAAGAVGQGGAEGGDAGMAGVGNAAGADGGVDAGGAGGEASGDTKPITRGPCDIYQDAGLPCVAAYSTVRRILSTYDGPLYQIRSGSSEQNTGSGGETHDVGQTKDGFADAAAVDAACAGTICTVSLLYDQSGKGSHLSVAKKGIAFGGPYAATDDFESGATRESLTVAGHKVYSLYMEAREGYRLARVGDGMPRKDEPLSIYLLADGTRAGVGCCWDFGNAPPDAQTFFDTTALFYGSGVDSLGAGEGPWFMMDDHTYISAGSSQGPSSGTPNPNNPFAEGEVRIGLPQDRVEDRVR